jgi:hypothetical protein
MKTILVVSILVMSALLLGAAAADSVTFVGHEKVAKGGTLVTAPDLAVSISHRTGPGEVEVHDKETDTLYVLDGEATVVTGGTMIGGKVTAPGQSRGTSINGGQSHHFVKGDVLVIWFKEVPKEINYYVVKVIKP